MYGSWSVAMFYSFESLKHYYFSPKPIDPLKTTQIHPLGLYGLPSWLLWAFFGLYCIDYKYRLCFSKYLYECSSKESKSGTYGMAG